MADAVEVAIELALLERATNFAAAQSPPLPLSVPNGKFPIPAASVTYLAATFMPVPSFSIGISWDAINQHYGILQLSVFGPIEVGDAAARRVGAEIVATFKRGTVLTRDGFEIVIYETPSIARSMRDDDRWHVPVSIPYRCFARPPS